jgi:hypothetical protein
MQSAGEPNIGRSGDARLRRDPAINRTLVWFSKEAERRRRRATAASEDLPTRRTDAASGWSGRVVSAEIYRRAQVRRAAYLKVLLLRIVATITALPKRAAAPNARRITASRRIAWQRPQLFGCVALTALAGAMIGSPFVRASAGPCRTEPAVLAPGVNADVRMTVSHNAACSIWAKANVVSGSGLRLAAPPQHGTLASRGRSGFTYRPAPGFTGSDSFAFSSRGTPQLRGEATLVHVDVTVR